MRKFLWPVLVILAGCAVPPREEAPPAAAVPAAPAARAGRGLEGRLLDARSARLP